MDLTIQMRSVELLVKFLKHDVSTIPPYGYMLQKEKYIPGKSAPVRLPVSTPEAEGIASDAVKHFFLAVGAEADSTAAHGMLVMRHGKVIAQGCWAPYRTDVPHMLYSMSKSITGTAVGFAVDEGYIALNERLIDVFPEFIGSAQAKVLRAHTIWNLLTMSSGSRFNEVGSMLDENWARMFMESIPKFEAGSSFSYNSLNSYMLAAAVVKRTGMSLTEFLTPRLYEPLGIVDHEWEKCPHGIEKGGWGLALTMEDAAKIGELYMRRGVWNGRRILSEAWCREATRVQMTTPNGEMKHGYGYQIWISDDEGSFQFNGAFGQYVVCMPKFDATVVIFSGSASLFAHSTLNDHIDALFAGASDTPLERDDAAYDSLRGVLSSLVFSPHHPAFDGLGTDADEFSHIAELLDGREYVLDNNTGGLFPQTVQSVHGNYTAGTDMLRFEKREDGLVIYFYEREERNALLIRKDGGLSAGAATMKGERQLTGTRALWRLVPGEIRLSILCSFIETPDTRIFNLNIKQNKLHIVFDERPALERVLDMLFELVGISQVAYVKKMLPEMRREHVDGLVRSIAVPRTDGTLIRHNEEIS